MLEWEDEALFAWEEELAKGDHHNDVLRNLELHDFDKFNELELRRQMLQGDLTNQQQSEQNEVDLMLRTQATLQAQAHLFNEIRKNRSKLMKRWYEASKMLETRKSQVEELENSALTLKIETEENIRATEPIQRRAENQKRENDIIKGGVERFNQRLKQGEELMTEKKKATVDLNEEIFNMDKEIDDQNSKNNLLKAKIKDLLETIKSRKEKAERISTFCMKLKTKLDTLNLKIMTDEQKHKNAEEIYQLGQKVLKEEEREFDRLQATISGLLNEMNRVKEEELFKRSDLELAKQDLAKIETILADIKLENESIKKEIQIKDEDVLYLTQKLREMIEDDLSSDVQRRFIQETTNIQMSIQSQKREQTTLRLEIKHLRKELRDVNRLLNKGTQELEQLGVKAVELKLKMIGANKTLREAQEEQNRVVLDHNLLKMQVNIAKEGFKKTDDQINNQERKKVVIESALQERTMDLKSHREKLVTRKKLLQEERTNLKKSVEHLNQRIKQLDNRHEIIMQTIFKDENGETSSVAYYQIKIAQEKRELIENGDELQAKIEKTEKEILAMENTLRLVSCTNDNFRSNLETIELNGPEMQEFDKVEGEYHQEHEQFMSNTRMIQDMTKAINKTKANIEKIRETGKEVEKKWKEKEKEIEVLTKALSTKQNKLGRATKILKKKIVDVKGSKGTVTYKHTMRDIEARIKAEQNQSALHQMLEFTQNYVEARPMVNMLLTENGVSLAERNTVIQIDSKITDGKEGSLASSRSGSMASFRTDIDQFKGSDISLSPSVVNLDPTLLIPGERKRAFKGYSSKFSN
uniref:Coiled-coil domain-containing protein 39 n=1 Tax=Lygus hesperus TaxID=30085 RepID=A0A0K8TJ05_LYGHE